MRLAQAKVHFIGIGGIGMCGLAELLCNMGGRVTGSDLSENAQTTRLRELGIDIKIGHRRENIQNAEVVVYTSAVKPENPEILEARRLKIPLIPRAEALAEMMRLKRGIAVGGSHGKTTTTSMTASIFLRAMTEPTIVIGGRLDLIKSTARLGTGDWMIAEADESDGSFSRLSPEIAIITNIDNDHLDYFGTFDHLKKAFFDFAMRTPFYGAAIVCGDDPAARETFQSYGKRVLFYGFGDDCDLRLEGSQGKYRVFREGKLLGELNLQVAGRHNALNAAASVLAGLEAGLPFTICAEGIEAYVGVDRRFQLKGENSGILVYDDYAHHPTEVKAVLLAFREKFPGRRLVTVFQPHRYSRTKICWDQFTTSFAETDELMVCDIYAAGEDPLAGVTSELLADAIRASGRSAQYLSSSVDRAARIREKLRPGDVLMTLGAGDVHKLGMQIVEFGSGK